MIMITIYGMINSRILELNKTKIIMITIYGSVCVSVRQGQVPYS